MGFDVSDILNDKNLSFIDEKEETDDNTTGVNIV